MTVLVNLSADNHGPIVNRVIEKVHRAIQEAKHGGAS